MICGLLDPVDSRGVAFIIVVCMFAQQIFCLNFLVSVFFSHFEDFWFSYLSFCFGPVWSGFSGLAASVERGILDRCWIASRRQVISTGVTPTSNLHWSRRQKKQCIYKKKWWSHSIEQRMAAFGLPMAPVVDWRSRWRRCLQQQATLLCAVFLETETNYVVPMRLVRQIQTNREKLKAFGLFGWKGIMTSGMISARLYFHSYFWNCALKLCQI